MIECKINYKLIEQYMFDNGLSLNMFCEKCKISKSTFYKIKNNKNCKLSSVLRISRVINIDFKNMFVS